MTITQRQTLPWIGAGNKAAFNAGNAILARILAQENIKVTVDASLRTADFNFVTRALRMPMFDPAATTEAVVDGLTVHEISHALFTYPYKDAEKRQAVHLGYYIEVMKAVGLPYPKTIDGLKNSLNALGPIYQQLQTIWNIIEDDRIERLIAAKYPGGGRMLSAMYKDMATGEISVFESLKTSLDVGFLMSDKASLIDRMIAALRFPMVQFPLQNWEEDLFNIIRKAETEQDVLVAWIAFAKCIDWPKIEFSREGQNSQNVPKEWLNVEDFENLDVPEDAEKTVNNKGGSSGDDGEDSDDKDSGDGEGEGKDSDDGEDSDDGDSGDGDDENSGGQQGVSNDDGNKTTFQEKNLLADAFEKTMESAKNSTLPTSSKIAQPFPFFSRKDLESYVHDYKSVLRDLAFYKKSDDEADPEDSNSYLRDVYVQSRAMFAVFQREMAGKISVNTNVSRTGKLDVNRLSMFKVADDIFLRSQMERIGQNHGVVILVDWSSSMTSIARQAMFQAAVVANFCRLANIPCDVYTFTNGTPKTNISLTPLNIFGSAVPSDIVRIMADTRMVHVFSSRMTTQEFRNMLDFTVGVRFSSFKKSKYGRMDGTPLDAAVIAMASILLHACMDWKIDIGNLIVCTDGSGDRSISGRLITDPLNPTRSLEVEYNYSNVVDHTTAWLMKLYKRIFNWNLISVNISNKTTAPYISGYTNENKDPRSKDSICKVSCPDVFGYDTSFRVNKDCITGTKIDGKSFFQLITRMIAKQIVNSIHEKAPI